MRSARQQRDRPHPPASGTVTRISPQRSDSERVNVHLDGQYAFSLSMDTLATHGPSVGDALSAADIARLAAADEPQRAVSAALTLLTHRGRSEQELRQRLARKGFTPEAVDSAIERVTGWGYLDDQAFAEAWVEQRSAAKPRSRRALQQELRDKGVDREIIAETIDAAPIDELADARVLAAGKWHRDRDQPLDKRRQRTANLLARRGYGWDVAGPVLRELTAEQEANADSDGENIVNDTGV